MSKDYPKESLGVSLCESVEVKIKCSLKKWIIDQNRWNSFKWQNVQLSLLK